MRLSSTVPILAIHLLADATRRFLAATFVRSFIMQGRNWNDSC